MQLAVTGATGHLGGRVARRLAAAGSPQRLIVREPGRAPELDGAEVVQAAYSDGDAAEAALSGVSTLFMVSGAEAPDRVAQHKTFIDAAAAAGVTHLVYVSFFGAAPDATFTLARDHWATEEHLKRAGMRYTILRDNLYLDVLPLLAGVSGVIQGPAGQGRVAAVARDDIADVAVTVLRGPQPHAGLTYDLTGPEALTMDEVARVLSAGTGREIRYQEETNEEAYASRAHYGAAPWQVDAWVSTYTAIANGEMAGVTGDVARVAGHPPLSLAEFLAQRRER